MKRAPVRLIEVMLACSAASSCGLRDDIDGHRADGLDASADPQSESSSDARVEPMLEGGPTQTIDAFVPSDAAMQSLLDARCRADISVPATDGGVAMSEVQRHFVSAFPGRGVTLRWAEGQDTAGLPLVVVYPGDEDDLVGTTVDELRALLPLEREASGAAVFAYPERSTSAWQHYSFDGRALEVEFLTDVVEAVGTELGVDTQRVLLVGWGGGGIIVNMLACTLGRDVHGSLRLAAVAVHSGTLYPLENPAPVAGRAWEFRLDFEDMTGRDAPRCEPPPAIVIWGKQDATEFGPYEQGRVTNEAYRRQLDCSYDLVPSDTADSCSAYVGCTRAHVWCAVNGLGHQIWSDAPRAIWNFFEEVASDESHCTR